MTENAAVVVTANLPPARLDALTRELVRDLSRTGALKARTVEKPAGPGERGTLGEVGKFFVDAVGGATVKAGAEAVKAVAEVLKAYLLREKSMSLAVSRPDGTKVEISWKNMSNSAVTSVAEQMLAAMERR